MKGWIHSFFRGFHLFVDDLQGSIGLAVTFLIACLALILVLLIITGFSVG